MLSKLLKVTPLQFPLFLALYFSPPLLIAMGGKAIDFFALALLEDQSSTPQNSFLAPVGLYVVVVGHFSPQFLTFSSHKV